MFVNKAFTKRIVELTKDESDVILGYLFNVRPFQISHFSLSSSSPCPSSSPNLLRRSNSFQLVALNHDNQVRFKWSKNDVAIWDNRSNWHTATYDHNEVRIGDRVVSLGEAPYFDTASVGRKEGLERRAAGKGHGSAKEELAVRGKGETAVGELK